MALPNFTTATNAAEKPERPSRLTENGVPSSRAVAPGEMFRRVHPDHTVETALVLGLQTGPLGIPHVRFSVHFERSRFAFFDDGPRILALASFTEYYREPVKRQA
jgi:hypothetical protein